VYKRRSAFHPSAGFSETEVNTSKPSPTEKRLKLLKKNEKNFTAGDFYFPLAKITSPRLFFLLFANLNGEAGSYKFARK
jgi:hypothetical protein